MLALFAVGMVGIVQAGCAPGPPYVSDEEARRILGPAELRIHPVFTGIEDFDGDGRLDGIEALVEVRDQFGDPTKASGRVVFELYGYAPREPDRRGRRLSPPWIAELKSMRDQELRWNRTSRTYAFPLMFRQVRPDANYVLTASFDTGEGRLFDELIVQALPPEPPQVLPATPPAAPARQEPTDQPATTPSGAPSE